MKVMCICRCVRSATAQRAATLEHHLSPEPTKGRTLILAERTVYIIIANTASSITLEHHK